jgi:hypothetical protein
VWIFRKLLKTAYGLHPRAVMEPQGRSSFFAEIAYRYMLIIKFALFPAAKDDPDPPVFFCAGCTLTD